MEFSIDSLERVQVLARLAGKRPLPRGVPQPLACFVSFHAIASEIT
jgi:hypothetical protein